MTTLTKSISVTSVGSPAIPGSPGTPPSPAYSYISSYLIRIDYSRWTNQYFPGTSVQPGYYALVPPPGPITYIRTPIYTTVPASPGTPPTPGTPGVPSAVYADYNIGWNASAYSIGSIDADGALEFSVPVTVVGAVVGLAFTYVGSGYANIDFGIYASHGLAQVRERGVEVGPAIAFTSTDVFRIQRTGATVRYFLNGVQFYISGTAAAAGPVIAAASLYLGGDSVTGATLVPVVAGAGGGASSMLPLTVYGYDGTTHVEDFSAMLPLTATASGRALVGMVAAMQPLTTLGFNGSSYTDSRAVMQPLSSSGSSGLLAPAFAVSAVQLPTLVSFGHGLSGEVATGSGAPMEPLQTLAADRSYATSSASMEPLTTFSTPIKTTFGFAEFTMGDYTLSASATAAAANAFAGAMPRFQLRAFGGGAAHLTAPVSRLSATGTVRAVGRATMAMPAPMLRANGRAGSTSAAHLTLHTPYGLRAYTGAVAAITLHDGFKLVMNGRIGSLGRATMKLPLYQLVATGTVHGLNSARLTMPAMQARPSGIARMTMGDFDLVAVGTAVVAVDYEAYAVNLLASPNARPGQVPGYAVTRFSRYPFDRIVRFNDRYYGVGPAGLYLLEGELDDTLPIAWVARTALEDFGTTKLKSIDAVYLNARLGASVTATVVVGEASTDAYLCQMKRGVNTQNHRVLAGKGIKSTHLAIELGDPAGASAEINSIDLRVNELQRTL